MSKGTIIKSKIESAVSLFHASNPQSFSMFITVNTPPSCGWLESHARCVTTISRCINLTDELGPWKVAYVIAGIEQHPGKHYTNDRSAAAALLMSRRKQLKTSLASLKRQCREDLPFQATVTGIRDRLNEVEDTLKEIAPGLISPSPPCGPTSSLADEDSEEEEDDDMQDTQTPTDTDAPSEKGKSSGKSYNIPSGKAYNPSLTHRQNVLEVLAENMPHTMKRDGSSNHGWSYSTMAGKAHCHILVAVVPMEGKTVQVDVLPITPCA